MDSVLCTAYSLAKGEYPQKKWFDLISDNEVLLDQVLSKKAYELMNNVLLYMVRQEGEELGYCKGGDFNQEELLEKIRKDFWVVFAEKKSHKI